MNSNFDLQFKVFDWLRFPLIVGVVFIHSFGQPFDFSAIDFSQLSGMDCYNLFRVSISKVLTHVCVPTFYLISGYLFFVGLEKWNINIYLRKLKKRCKSLLAPFLIWNTIALALPLAGAFRHDGWFGIQSFLQEHDYWHLYWDSNQWNLDRTNLLGVGNFASSPYLVPLWFLRDLMVVIICSPILYYLFKKLKSWGLLLLALCYFSGVFINKPGFSTTAFLFFGAGAYFKMNNIDVTKVSYRYRKAIYLLAFILWIVCALLNGHETKEGDLIYPFYVITGCAALLNLSTCIVDKNLIKMPQLCSKGAFFIYLLHTVMVLQIAKAVVLRVIGNSNPLVLTIGYFSVPVMTVAVCLIVYYILNKYTPSLCKILVGGR